MLAGDEGLEPSQNESESFVLPLHQSPKMVVEDGYAPSSFDYQSKALAIELHDHTLAESDGNAPSLSGSKPPVLLLYDDSMSHNQLGPDCPTLIHELVL